MVFSLQKVKNTDSFGLYTKVMKLYINNGNPIKTGVTIALYQT